MSFVYEVGGTIAGAVLCGTDGRRGFLHHLAVQPEHQRRGVGRTLATRALGALAEAGLDKAHLMVLPSNTAARQFWKALGWVERTDVVLMSRTKRTAVALFQGITRGIRLARSVSVRSGTLPPWP